MTVVAGRTKHASTSLGGFCGVKRSIGSEDQGVLTISLESIGETIAIAVPELGDDRQPRPRERMPTGGTTPGGPEGGARVFRGGLLRQGAVGLAATGQRGPTVA